MREDGADIIDVGGESTRPGFAEVGAEEELRRVIPVIERLAKETRHPGEHRHVQGAVAKAAIEAGAALVNDVHGFQREPEIARVAAEAGVPAVAMHYQRGREFKDTIGNIVEGWLESLRIAREQGLPDERIILDPGFNFGWTEEQALEMLRRLRELRVLGRPLLVGTSRKSTIGIVLGGLPVEDRLEGTAATVAISIANGADIVRVHDVQGDGPRGEDGGRYRARVEATGMNRMRPRKVTTPLAHVARSCSSDRRDAIEGDGAKATCACRSPSKRSTRTRTASCTAASPRR